MTEESDDLKNFTREAKQLAAAFKANPEYSGPDLLKRYIDENRKKVKSIYVEVLDRLSNLSDQPSDTELKNLVKSVNVLFSEMAAIGNSEDWENFLHSSNEYARATPRERKDGRFKIEDVTQDELDAYRNSLLEHPHIQGIKQLSEQGSKLFATEHMQKVIADKTESMPGENMNQKGIALLHKYNEKKKKRNKYSTLKVVALLGIVTFPLALYFEAKSIRYEAEERETRNKLEDIVAEIKAYERATGDKSEELLELSDSEIEKVTTTLISSLRETAAEAKELLKGDDPAPKNTQKNC